MIELEALFDLRGIEFSEKPKKQKAPAIVPDKCKITQNKGHGRNELATRFAFLGSYAELIRPFDFATYGVEVNGTVHFFFGHEKPRDSSFKLQKNTKSSVWFVATPKTEKEEKFVRKKLANKSFDVIVDGENGGVLHLYISLSNSQPLETSQEEQETDNEHTL